MKFNSILMVVMALITTGVNGEPAFSEHMIVQNYDMTWYCHAIDMEADGDMDILASICGLDQLFWFRNDGLVFTPALIETNFLRPHCIYDADIDRD